MKEHTASVEIRDGQVYVTRRLEGLDPSKLTKWDLLSFDEKVRYAKTKYGNKCAKCGKKLATEADFASHYIIDDVRYLTLGRCSNTSEE